MSVEIGSSVPNYKLRLRLPKPAITDGGDRKIRLRTTPTLDSGDVGDDGEDGEDGNDSAEDDVTTVVTVGNVQVDLDSDDEGDNDGIGVSDTSGDDEFVDAGEVVDESDVDWRTPTRKRRRPQVKPGPKRPKISPRPTKTTATAPVAAPRTNAMTNIPARPTAAQSAKQRMMKKLGVKR